MKKIILSLVLLALGMLAGAQTIQPSGPFLLSI